MSLEIGKGFNGDKVLLHYDVSNSNNFLLKEVEVLVVAGGGGGGANHAGGGGGGGVVYNPSYTVVPGRSISVTVGDGGITPTSSTNPAASNGGNSIFDALVAFGGGGGGNRNDVSGTSPGRGGGSGGGGGGGQAAYSGNWVPGTGVRGQGHRGGTASDLYGGGGGGAGQEGMYGFGNASMSGKGGDGLPFDISGTLRYYGGGGGGSTGQAAYVGKGGLGGGGNGGTTIGTNGTPGAPNTGGGGGGGGAGGTPGSNGGSGIVIVRYYGPQKAVGGTVSRVNGYTIHTFTTVGTTSFTPNAIPTNGSILYGLEDISGRNASTSIIGTGLDPIYDTTLSVPTATFTANDAYLQSNSGDFISVKDKTVQCWVYLQSTSLKGTIFRLGDLNTGWSIGIGSATTDSLGNEVIALYPNRRWIPTGSNAGTGWHLITMIVDGQNLPFVYLDTTLILNGDVGNAPNELTLATRRFSYIGRNVGDEPGGTPRTFGGHVSSIILYDRVLTGTEINNNYNNTKGRYGL